MQNYDIIWLAWLASPAVSRVARMRSVVPSDCLPSVTTADNSTNKAIPTILPMSWTSLAHYISHSLFGSLEIAVITWHIWRCYVSRIANPTYRWLVVVAGDGGLSLIRESISF